MKEVWGGRPNQGQHHEIIPLQMGVRGKGSGQEQVRAAQPWSSQH